MKVLKFALASLLLSTPSLYAAQTPRTVEVNAAAGVLQAEAQDGELVRVLLPYVEKAEPRAEIQEESLVYDDRCEILSLKNEAPQVEVMLRMPSTVADSGFNGCRVMIDRGFTGDDSDTVHLSYGYEILD